MSTRTSPILSAILTPLLVICPVWAQTPLSLANSPLDSAMNQPIQLHMIESDGPQAQVSSRGAKGITVQVTDSTGAGVPDAAVVFRLPDSGPTGIFTDGTHSAVAYTDGSGSAHVTGIQWNGTPGPLAIRVTATKGTSHAGILIEQTLSSSMELAAATATPVAPVSALPSAPLPAPSTMPTPGAIRSTTTGASASAQDIKPASNTSIAQVNSEPSVSVTSASPGTSAHSSKKKWLIIAAIAAGAGVGAAMAMKGKSSGASSTPASTLSIGSPTVSIGHP